MEDKKINFKDIFLQYILPVIIAAAATTLCCLLTYIIIKHMDFFGKIISTNETFINYLKKRSAYKVTLPWSIVFSVFIVYAVVLLFLRKKSKIIFIISIVLISIVGFIGIFILTKNRDDYMINLFQEAARRMK